MADMQIRNVDESLWLQLRLKAVERGMSMGALLNEIIREWLARQ
jgi:plasmid stability protein